MAAFKRLLPLLNRVLVEKIVPPSKTNIGILLPEKTTKLNPGKVVAVGPGAYDRHGNLIPVAFKAGDHVPLPEYGGSEFKLNDKERANTYRDSALWSRVILPNGTGIGYPVRHLTTVTHPEKAVNEAKPVASTDTYQPQRIKFKRLDKTARHIMNILDKEEVDKVKAGREIPEIKPGYIVQLKVEVPENKRRVSILKGIIIARRNAGLHTTFRLRRLVAGVGVESVFPLYSPNIKEMKVLDKKDVRRAKLYYLRDRMNALKQK